MCGVAPTRQQNLFSTSPVQRIWLSEATIARRVSSLCWLNRNAEFYDVATRVYVVYLTLCLPNLFLLRYVPDTKASGTTPPFIAMLKPRTWRKFNADDDLRVALGPVKCLRPSSVSEEVDRNLQRNLLIVTWSWSSVRRVW